MQISQNKSLKLHNTFGVNVKAKRFGTIKCIDDLTNTLPLMREEKALLFLGSGSNILFTKDYDGLVLNNQLRGKDIIHEDENGLVLQVSGGENWSDLVDYTVEMGWGGIENLSLIPGTVGAAPVQNIGAYGVELNELLIAVEAIEISSGNIHQFANIDCEFSYRSSIFKTSLRGKFFITSVLLKLSKKPVLNLSYTPLKKALSALNENEVNVQLVSKAVKEIRRSKLPDPEELGNAGSFFKNPMVQFSKIEELISDYPEIPFYKVDDDTYKIAAGWLIEKSGWKGKRIGNAGVHAKQALVIVNYGGASGKEILQLSEKIKEDVKAKFNIGIVPEVTIL